MSHSELHSGDDLRVLRAHIGRLAMTCELDLGHGETVARLLAGDHSLCHGHRREAELLRALLILRYRLEASVSEDLGIAGLTKLWQQHDDILARHDFSGRGQSPRNDPGRAAR